MIVFNSDSDCCFCYKLNFLYMGLWKVYCGYVKVRWWVLLLKKLKFIYLDNVIYFKMVINDFVEKRKIVSDWKG